MVGWQADPGDEDEDEETGTKTNDAMEELVWLMWGTGLSPAQTRLPMSM